MTKFFIAATAAIALSAPLLAEPVTIVSDGQQLSYDVAFVDGYQVVTGTNLTTGVPFELRERNGRVRGRFGSEPVNYRVSVRKPARLASR